MQQEKNDIPIIHLKEISVSYNDHKVLKDVTFRVPRGIIQVIAGESGIGKTTLLKIINGLVPIDQGVVQVFGVTCSGKSDFKKIRSQIGYIPQNLGLVRNSSALENVLMGSLSRTKTFPSLFNIFPKKEISLAENFLESLGIASKRDKIVQQLSGGEKKRVAIARALMQMPKLLLADEFLSDLDEANKEKIMDRIVQMKEELNLSVIMVEHNMSFAKKYGDRIAMISEEGTLSEYQP